MHYIELYGFSKTAESDLIKFIRGSAITDFKDVSYSKRKSFKVFITNIKGECYNSYDTKPHRYIKIISTDKFEMEAISETLKQGEYEVIKFLLDKQKLKN